MVSKLFFPVTFIIGALCLYDSQLRFNSNGEFTILQLTDMHYGENPDSDRNTTLLQEKLINHTHPDLVVVTGDSVSGYAWDGLNTTFYSDCWKMWTSALLKLKVPYVYTLGNHDDQGDYSRKQICDLDMTHKFSMIQFNGNVTGATNYHVPIYSSNSSHSDKPSTILWMFDTNDEVCEGMNDSWGCVEKDQIEWYNRESKSIKESHDAKGLAFFHIPLPEYRTIYNWRRTYGERWDSISCPKKNTDLFKHLLANGNIRGTFCGHDHNNDFGGFLYGIELVFGRKTGYGGYGPSNFQRGGRVIKLKEKYDPQTGKMDFDYYHYVIQEDGSIMENSHAVWKGLFDFFPNCDR